MEDDNFWDSFNSIAHFPSIISVFHSFPGQSQVASDNVVYQSSIDKLSRASLATSTTRRFSLFHLCHWRIVFACKFTPAPFNPITRLQCWAFESHSGNIATSWADEFPTERPLTPSPFAFSRRFLFLHGNYISIPSELHIQRILCEQFVETTSSLLKK